MNLVPVDSWPASIDDLHWPSGGTKYSYENRYIKAEKLKLWLDKAFGPGVAKSVYYSQRFYIKSPRRPTEDEEQWLMDPSKKSRVHLKGHGWLQLSDAST